MSRLKDEGSNSDEEKPVPPFLLKTYNMVQDKKTDDIISWTEKGDSFVVKKQHEFSQNVLPQYFRTNCFASFVRQLNFYGFRKRKINMSTQAFFKHKHFKKDQMDKLHLIKKKPSESSNMKMKQTVAEIKQSNAEMKKEIANLKEKYNQIWNVLMMVTSFGRNNYPQLQAPSPTANLRFMFPNNGMPIQAPSPTPPLPSSLSGNMPQSIPNLQTGNTSDMAALFMGSGTLTPLLDAPTSSSTAPKTSGATIQEVTDEKGENTITDRKRQGPEIVISDLPFKKQKLEAPNDFLALSPTLKSPIPIQEVNGNNHSEWPSDMMAVPKGPPIDLNGDQDGDQYSFPPGS
mmetsp:Transcript_16247/g.24488  ORF Transcript_16247/g.24488 Transcript_16247/m.24488 type:complete len:345 (-) Transcript_16247:144-1178(-)